ncbi:protein translocase SEC61 complex subunit gamma [Candidatus Pacearchaeota archaeon]|nr:protein translocase SEC61 complex subunit gamma [Candidatus Pacearchaeota archaeon]
MNQTIGWKSRLGSFLVQCKRVWQVLRKPTNEEFKTIAKISAIGVLIIGAVGFIIADLIKFITKIF